MPQKGSKKPRISEYGKSHSVRFRKNTERDLSMFSIEHSIKVSRIIQVAVACFLTHPECLAKHKILDELK